MAVGDNDEYDFVSSVPQWVTIVVTPTGMTADQFPQRVTPADYTVQLKDLVTGQIIAVSDANDRINWIHIQVPPGAQLGAIVNLRDDRGGQPHTYRLTVTGSTDQFQYLGCNPSASVLLPGQRYITGNHLQSAGIVGQTPLPSPAPVCDAFLGNTFDNPIG